MGHGCNMIPTYIRLEKEKVFCSSCSVFFNLLVPVLPHRFVYVLSCTSSLESPLLHFLPAGLKHVLADHHLQYRTYTCDNTQRPKKTKKKTLPSISTRPARRDCYWRVDAEESTFRTSQEPIYDLRYVLTSYGFQGSVFS